MKRMKHLIGTTLAVIVILSSMNIMQVQAATHLASTVSTADATASIQQVNSILLDDINALRTQNNLPALTQDLTLNSYAAIRAQEAATTWSHTRPDGTQGCNLISADKYRGENLSYVTYSEFGFTEAEQAEAASIMYDALAASPGHYANMVNAAYTQIGIYTYTTQTESGVKLTVAYMFSN
ncbi:MAG: CAP domain-containing protein [Clostridium sp.]